MDREEHWERTNLAYQTIAFAKADRYTSYLEFYNSTNQTIFDEFVQPIVVSQEYRGVKNNDTMLFFNFRADRMRQIVRAFADKQCSYIEKNVIDSLNIYTLTDYDQTFSYYGVSSVFCDAPLKNTLTEIVSNSDKKVLKVAESTKYAHVTYFFNGGEEKPFHNEDRILLPSKNVSTFDLKPKMSARGITKAVIGAIKKNNYDLIVFNFANGDMVGHSGDLSATIKAMKYIGKKLSEIYKISRKMGYEFIITADHGNAEMMLDAKNQMWTAHTLNPVPFVVCNNDIELKKGEFALGNIAPTILEIMCIEKTKEMTECSLIENKS